MTWELEPTCRINAEELLGLLETTSSSRRQRITAEIPTATLEGLLQPEGVPVQTAPVDTAIVATVPSRVARANRLLVIAISFVATLLVGLATGAVL